MPVSTKPPFKALIPHESVVILLLVENSSTMSNMWNEVQHRYLAPLGEMLQFPNEGSPASMTTILLESMSIESGGRLGALPRRYSSYSHALESVKFCPHPGNVITAEMISQGIDILSSARIPGRPPILHLVVVSTNSIYHERWRPDVRSLQRSWDKQVLRLKEAGIRCHLVYRPNQDMGGLASLFNTATKMQNFWEKTLPSMSASMPVESSKNTMVVRSVGPGPRDFSGTMGTEVEKECAPSNNDGRIDYSNSKPIQSGNGNELHGKISRQVQDPHVLPLNPETLISTPSPKPPAKPPRVPGIVARLQQVHGLTKKKLYGSANRPTSLTPFFKEEKATTSTGSIPPQPTQPLGGQKRIISPTYPSSNSGGKVQTRSREGRKIRQAQRTTTTPLGTSRGGKNSSRSPLSGSNLAPSVSSSSPTQHSEHSSYGDASTTVTAAQMELCGSCSQNIQGNRDFASSHTDVTQGPQPLPSHPPTLGSGNGTLDYSSSFLISSNIMTFETSPTSRLGEQAHFVDPSLFVQSNIDYTWHLPHHNTAQVNSFPLSSEGEMIIPSDSTPHTLPSSPGMVPYISSEHILSNHLANTAEHGSYGQPVAPDWISPTFTGAHALSTPASSVSDNILSMVPHETSNSDVSYEHYYSTVDSPPQFYHSSSSSLSAMITPRVQTDLFRHTDSGW